MNWEHEVTLSEGLGDAEYGEEVVLEERKLKGRLTKEAEGRAGKNVMGVMVKKTWRRVIMKMNC